MRIGGGNLKSLVVLVIASVCAYWMLWTNFYAIVFDAWMSPLTINLGKLGMKSQALDAIVGGVTGMQMAVSAPAYLFRTNAAEALNFKTQGSTVSGVQLGLSYFLAP